jgi:hypothetical protein
MAERKPSDDKAAFGVYPQMRGKRSRQDPEAAKNVPVDLARGFVAGTLGMPGDIESLVRMLPGLDEKTFLPTSEDIEKRLPFRSDTPVSRAASGLGILGGGFYTGPGSAARAITAVPSAVKRAGLDFAVASGQPTANVVKPSGKGANWLDGKRGSVEAQLDRMKMGDTSTPEWYADRARYLEDAKAKGDERAIRAIEYDVDVAKRNDAMNAWIQGNLRNYVKNQMATPDDPVRKLAEEGILHMAPYGEQGVVSSRLMNKRLGMGQDPLGMGRSDPARFWERMSDISVDAYPAGSYKHGSLDESLLADNPWLQKVPDDTMIYSGKGISGDLGFDHILDVLREDLTAGRIRPEQLNKVSMEQAVRRTHQYDQELAAKMDAARASAREGLPVYKEYPEGYRWVELNKPGSFAAESEAMGHSVRGYEPPQGHPDWMEGSGGAGSLSYGHGGWEAIKSGRAKVYSLVDSKGAPHTTVEVSRNQMPFWEDVKKHLAAAEEEAKKLPNGYTEDDIEKIANRMARNEMPPQITQIKGKSNRAPNPEYLPFVQDFVKSGEWSDVGDLQNTGLRRTSDAFNETEQAFLRSKGVELKPYIEPEETARYQELFTRNPGPNLEDGMKRGGVVISNNPDTMMLEVNNKRMKGGGAEDDTKPYFGGAATKKYAAAKKRAEQADVNLLPDPKTYAAVSGLLGTAPDEMGFSVLRPDYQAIRDVAEPAFYTGTALGIAPLAKALNAPLAAAGKALEPAAGRFVTKTMERGGLGADILRDMGQGSRSYAYLPHTPGKPDPTVGSRYKTQSVGNLAPKRDFDIQAEKGSSVMSNPWDSTSRGEKVLEVSDTPLVDPFVTEGGQDFARDLVNIQSNIGGASGRQIAERMQDRVNDAYFANMLDKGTGRIFTMPSTMEVTGSNYSTMPTDIIMDFFKQAELPPKYVDRVTDDLRSFVFEEERGKFKNAAKVGSPEFMKQLREGGEGFSAGDLRKGLMNRMSKAEYQKLLGYNIEDVYGAIHDPTLKDLPKGFVGNTMIETSPFASVGPSTHQSYNASNAGKYAGSMPSMPIELMMPDLYQAMEINYLKSPKYQSLSPSQLRTMIINTIEKRGSVISQPINDRVIDNAMRYQEGLKQGHFNPKDYDSIMEFMRRTGGYKKGGAVKVKPQVKKAEGGAIDYDTTPDMSDGGRIIEGAPFKHGGKVKMTANRDAMFLELSNKKLKRK